MQQLTTDIAIFGGGIAGLWLLNRLRQIGYQAILLETDQLGGGQTTKAQGIIHGGFKYNLDGNLTKDGQALHEMPKVWQAALNGAGVVDLSNVPILSAKQYVWSPSRLKAKLGQFFAKASLQSQIKTLLKEEYPIIFKDDAFHGKVFALEELVIDTFALVRTLAHQQKPFIFKIDDFNQSTFCFDPYPHLTAMHLKSGDQSFKLQAKQFIFTAGKGNGVILEALKDKKLAMQLRPLHMVMVKMPFSLELYAHCLGISAKPRLTITTHYLKNGSTIWYLGGLLAEEGINRTKEEQLKVAYQELSTLFPWLDLRAAQFASFIVERAEPSQLSGEKPNSSYFYALQNIMIAWPTKLALTPQLTENIIHYLQTLPLKPSNCSQYETIQLPLPTFAQPIWEKAFCKNV